MPTINGKVFNDVMWAAAQRSQAFTYEGFERPSDGGWLLGVIQAYHYLEEQLLAGGMEPGRLAFIQEIPDDALRFGCIMMNDGMQGLQIFGPRLH